MERKNPPGQANFASAAQADQRERSIATVAALLANSIPDAFSGVARNPPNEIAFVLDRDFSALEQRRFLDLAATVIRRLAERGGRAPINWNAMGLVGIAGLEAPMSNKPSAADERANNPEQRPDKPSFTPPLDVDPMEGGGVVPGGPPGETFGSTATTPPSEAEQNERAGHRPNP
ncbi:hypothetical protein GCM10007036_37090 [Alsobacter metallidurans]|uniref:Uncharacterized protein n=1 Tax=Alsobacter metallidurans TaxID=340221 RepID=A0A917MJP2_9HYPH|nr:hypothetical protein [Alsobacter metallidurans]GGH28092.1 hypothetical protein GCM10007036_37090 [Alsobacter metallidurans]